MVNTKNKSAQDIQDRVFLKMSAEKKIKIVSNLFELAKKLNPEYLRNYGTAKTTDGYRKNTR